MNAKSQQIHDMIQTFPLGENHEAMASRLLDILQAVNERMDEIEAAAQHANNIASCLANGIRPD